MDSTAFQRTGFGLAAVRSLSFDSTTMVVVLTLAGGTHDDPSNKPVQPTRADGPRG